MAQFKMLALCLLILVLESVRSEILASSGSPMAGANPSRNNQVNKKLLCPSVAPGKTQVWNVEWKTALPSDFRAFFGSDTDLTLDEQGFIYVHCLVDGDPNSKILKINGADGSYDINLAYAAPFQTSAAVPTHVKGNKMYIAAAEMTTIVNTTSMTDIAVVPHATFDADTYAPGSYAPLKNDFMVTASPDQAAADILRYLKTSSAQFDSSQPNFNGALANNVIVYTNTSGIDISIVVLGTRNYPPAPITIWSPNYQITLPGSNLIYVDSYVQNNQLVVQYSSYGPQRTYTIAIFDPETGASIQNVTRNFSGEPESYIYSSKLFGNKSVGYSIIDFNYKIVDFWNEKVFFENRILKGRPLYSIPDNSVLLATLDASHGMTYFPTVELICLDWNTNTINAVGSFPTDAYFGDGTVSPPIIGEDCMLYQYLNDHSLYPSILFAFKPLPVSDIVPILECINDDGVGYFSYNNLEDKRIVIPYTSDRNNLIPMDLAPTKDFRAHRGRYFPMSSPVSLDNSTSSFTWQLEDYVLSFNNTMQLRCPQDVTIILYFTATNTVPSGFDEWTRQAFVNLTGISDSRVTVVTNGSQGSVPSDITFKLHITTGNSTEMTPELAAQNFVEEQTLRLAVLLNSDPTYSSSSIFLIDVDGAGPLATEISGINQSPPLTQAPISQPNTQTQPNTQGEPPLTRQSPTSTPTTRIVSTGCLPSLAGGMITILALACIIA